MSSEDMKCPMCGENIGLGNRQLHYLTQCKGYDKKDDDPGAGSTLDPPSSKPASQTKRESRPKTFDSKPQMEDSRAPEEVQTSITHQPATYLVTFLWRPLTSTTFKKVTLLSHFQVEMKVDAQHGYYISDAVEVSEGEFDGQIVFGHSYCYALKKFVVDKSTSVVVLELDVSKMTESEPDDTASGSYYYTTTYPSDTHGSSSGISLQSNPAYGYSRDPYTSSALTGEVYSSHGMQYMYEGDKHDSSTHVHYCPVHKCYHPVETRPHYYGYDRDDEQPPPTEDEFLTVLDDAKEDSYSKKLSEEGFAPAAVKSKTSSRQRASSFDSRKYQDSSYSTTGTYYSPAYKSSYSTSSHDPSSVHSSSYPRGTGSGGGKYGTGTSPDTSPVGDITINPLRTKNATSIAQSYSTSVGSKSTSAGPRKSASTAPISAGGDRETGASSSKSAVVKDSFAVSEVQSGEGDPKALKAELAQVARERDSLKQSLERVSAQWEGKVKRLQDKLRQLQQGEEESADVLADVEEISRLQTQLQEANDDLSNKEKILMDKEKELSECKDRVTALEDQLVEYAATVQEQNKGVMTMQSRFSAFAETISMLEGKASRIDVLEAENATLQQSTQILTSDLKDNQQLIRQLTATIKEKEDDIRQLQQSESSVGRHAEALELETMRQKYEAWMKTAEDLTNENELLKRELRKLEGEQDSLNGTVETLQHQLRLCKEECTAKQTERDVLEARFAELQEVRMQQERDLTTLRSERAGILQKSVELSEASKPEKYQRLKKENSQLQSQRKELQTQCEEAQRLVKIHQDKNVELQRMLEEASNPAKLRAIEQKMQKYKQERDQAKEELRSRQAIEEEWRRKEQDQWKELESNRVEMSKLGVVLEAVSVKKKQYKDECRQLQKCLDGSLRELEAKETEVAVLQRQIEQLTGAITEQADSHFSAEGRENLKGASYGDRGSKVSESFRQVSYPDVSDPTLPYDQDKLVSSETNLSTRGAFRDSPSKSSRQRGIQEYDKHIGLPKNKPRQSQTSVVASLPPRTTGLGQSLPQRSYDDLSYEVKELGFTVMTASGRVNMELKKPSQGSMKKHTRVVVKRDNGVYVMGTLMFVGKPDRKEMAGVILEVKRADSSPSTPHDGTFKNGERYFECPSGYGLYTTLSNIFVPVHQL